LGERRPQEEDRHNGRGDSRRQWFGPRALLHHLVVTRRELRTNGHNRFPEGRSEDPSIHGLCRMPVKAGRPLVHGGRKQHREKRRSRDCQPAAFSPDTHWRKHNRSAGLTASPHP
jgi:hypothetical protein